MYTASCHYIVVLILARSHIVLYLELIDYEMCIILVAIMNWASETFLNYGSHISNAWLK